jgi:hypothetical protein
MSTLEKTLEKGLDLDFNKLIQEEKKSNDDKNKNVEPIISNIKEIEENFEDKDEDEFGKVADLMNIHQTYFRTLFKKNNNENMFEEINYEDKTSTNRSLELFYEYFYEYKTNLEKGEEYVSVYTEDTIEQDKFEVLYGVLIDGDVKYLSPCIYSLYLLLADNKIIKWRENKLWKIIQIKSAES